MLDNNVKSKNIRKPKIYTTKTIDTRSHAFNVGIAKDYSIEMAIWLGHLSFWTEKNLAHEKHIYDGRVWCYDTLESLREYFPYYTKRQLETIINNSVKEGLVVKGNYNQTEYDRTCWYALNPKSYFYFQYLLTKKNRKKILESISQICEMEITDLWNRFFRSVTPIPDTDPDTDPSLSLSPSAHDEKEIFDSSKAFDEICSAYPIVKNKPSCFKLWKKLKPNKELKEKIISDIENKKLMDSHWLDGYPPSLYSYLVHKGWEEEVFNREEIKTKVKKEHKDKINQENKRKLEEQAAYSEKRLLEQMEKDKNNQIDKKIIYSITANENIKNLKKMLGR